MARTLAEAIDAAAEVAIDYDPLPVVIDAEQALHGDSPVLHPKLKTNVVYRKAWARGGVASAFRDPPVLVEQRIVHQRVAAVTLEGRAVLAVPPQQGERTLTVWSSTQMPHGLRD
jgi:carbon-monoxide dehydrogenase large subunit